MLQAENLHRVRVVYIRGVKAIAHAALVVVLSFVTYPLLDPYGAIHVPTRAAVRASSLMAWQPVDG